MLVGPLNAQEENNLVSDYVASNGCWNLDNLSFSPPQSFLDVIQAIPTNPTSLSSDIIAWSPASDGNFTLGSAYLLAKGLNVLNPTTNNLNWILKMNTPQKIILFVWLCSRNSIPVRKVLGSRGLTIDQICPLCHSHEETINHLLREFHFSASFWNQLGLPSKVI